jgi:hypothetical protein
MAELATLVVMTADLARNAAVRRCIGRAAAAGIGVQAALAAYVVLAWSAGVATALAGTYGDLVPGRYARVQGFAFHPNALAGWGLFAVTATAMAGSGLGPVTRRVLAGLGAATVALTFSRTVVSLAFALLARRWLARGRRAPVALAGLAVAALLVALTAIHVRVDPTRPWHARIDSAPSPRLAAARECAAVAARHLLFGLGPGRVCGSELEAHVAPLNVAATLGLPGLAVAACVGAAAWRAGRGTRDPALVGGLLAFVLEALAGDVEDARHLWMLIGLNAAVDKPADGT